MCRKNVVLGAALLACGAGLLLSFLLTGPFLRVVVAAVLLAAGVLTLRN